jgi:hypothetical protein
MVVLSQERTMARCMLIELFSIAMLTFIATNERSEVNRKNSAKVDKHIDAVLLPTEPGMRFSTHYMANLFDTTPTTSSNTSHLICLWRMANARVFLLTTRRTVPCIDSEHTTLYWLPVVTDVHTSAVHLHILVPVMDWPWLHVPVFPIRISSLFNSTRLVSMELAA